MTASKAAEACDLDIDAVGVQVALAQFVGDRPRDLARRAMLARVCHQYSCHGRSLASEPDGSDRAEGPVERRLGSPAGTPSPRLG